MDNDKLRINLNVRPHIKDIIQANAAAKNKTITDYIIDRCTTEDIQTDTQELDRLKQQLDNMQINHANALQMYDQQLRILQDTLQQKRADYDNLQDNYNQLQQRYDFTLQAMVWHSMPWWRKIGKRIELPNKEPIK